MTPICIHIKSDGVRCGSPAMRGHSRCYFHLKRHYREKPRRQPKLPPRMSSGARHVFQTLERHTADDVLSTEQLIQVYKQAQRAMRRHLEKLKRPVLQPEARNLKRQTQNARPNPTPASAVTEFASGMK